MHTQTGSPGPYNYNLGLSIIGDLRNSCGPPGARLRWQWRKRQQSNLGSPACGRSKDGNYRRNVNGRTTSQTLKEYRPRKTGSNLGGQGIFQDCRLERWTEHVRRYFSWLTSSVDISLLSASVPMKADINRPSEVECYDIDLSRSVRKLRQEDWVPRY